MWIKGTQWAKQLALLGFAGTKTRQEFKMPSLREHSQVVSYLGAARNWWKFYTKAEMSFANTHSYSECCPTLTLAKLPMERKWRGQIDNILEDSGILQEPESSCIHLHPSASRRQAQRDCSVGGEDPEGGIFSCHRGSFPYMETARRMSWLVRVVWFLTNLFVRAITSFWPQGD